MIPLFDDNPTHRKPVFTFLIILINTLVFFGWQMRIGLEDSVDYAGFVPAELTNHVPGAMTRLLIAMFMHGGFMHLLGNMWFMYIFGDNVENATGHIRFVAFYVLTGVAATLGYTYFDPESKIPLVGASGAISGVLGAYLVKHPTVPIRTLIPLGIFTRIVILPAYFFLFVWIGMQVLSQVAISARTGHHGGGVAYMAHIAGFVAGVVLIFVFQQPAKQAGRKRRDW